MDYHQQHEEGGGGLGGGSYSNSPSSSELNHHQQYNARYNPINHNHSNHNHNHQDPMQSWWETVSKTRSRIQALLSLLPSHFSSDSLSSLADSDRPARSLLDSHEAYCAVSAALSGSGDDPLCQWLYDTFQSSTDNDNDDLRLVVLSFVPAVVGLYLTRIHAFSTVSPNPPLPSLAGFEAVLLALYSSEVKSRSGKPLLVSIPSPAYLNHHPSLYHTVSSNSKSTSPSPRSHSNSSSPSSSYVNGGINVGIVCPPLEPEVGIKSTKRATIVGVAFHCFYTHISHMPSWSKLDLCRFAASWAGDDCLCALSLDFNHATNNADDDEDVSVTLSLPPNGSSGNALSSPDCNNSNTNGQIIHSEDMTTWMRIQDNDIQGQQQQQILQGSGRIPLPWDLLQPLLRILGHCLLGPLNPDDIKDAASVAARRLSARASHDLSPQALLATRSLVHLDNQARAAAKAAALANPSSNATTPRLKKPEVLLVSK